MKELRDSTTLEILHQWDKLPSEAGKDLSAKPQLHSSLFTVLSEYQK
jgi:hypothetical protein